MPNLIPPESAITCSLPPSLKLGSLLLSYQEGDTLAHCTPFSSTPFPPHPLHTSQNLKKPKKEKYSELLGGHAIPQKVALLFGG